MAVTTIDNSAPETPKRKHVATGQKPPGGARPGAGHPVTNGNGSKSSTEPAPLGEGSFWEWTDNLPREAWSQNLIAYLWRCGPLIDTGNGKPTSIAKLSQAFDVNFILENYGSGLYRIDVCETPPAPGQKGKCIRRSYENVLDMKYPPKIPMGTWIDDPRNASWQWCKPDLEAEAESRKAQPPQQSNTLGDLLDIQLKLKELNGDKPDNSMTAVLVQLLSNQDPTKQLELTRAMMEMADSKRSSGGETAMALVVQILREQLQSVQEDLRAMRSAGPPDPFSGVKPVLELLSNLGVNIGGAAPRSNPGDTLATTLGDIATKVIDKGADLAPLIIQAYQFGKQKDLEIAVHGKKEPPQTNPDRPWEFKANAVAPPEQQQQPAPAEVVQSIPQPMTPQGLYLKYKGLIQSIFPFLQDHFKRTNGDEFREWFIESKGTDTWSAFKKDATPELLIQLIGMTPQNIKDVFAPPEAVQAFFHDMLDEEGADARDSVDDNIEEGDGTND